MSEHSELAKAIYYARRPQGTWDYMTERQKDSYERSATRLADVLPHIGYPQAKDAE